MTLFYSAATGGFYDSAIHGDAIPDDARPITAKRHANLLFGQAGGAQIVADAKGRPSLQKPTADERRAALTRAIKREARRRIEAVSPPWRQMNDLREPTPEGAARFAAIDAIRAASAAIEEALAATVNAALPRFAISENTLWPTE